jgi:hypothetical protein
MSSQATPSERIGRRCGRVYLPNALSGRYSNAARQRGRQYTFPAKTLSVYPRSGMKKRHHLHVSSVQGKPRGRKLRDLHSWQKSRRLKIFSFIAFYLFQGRWEGKDHKISRPLPDDVWLCMVCCLRLLIINLTPAAGTPVSYTPMLHYVRVDSNRPEVSIPS